MLSEQFMKFIADACRRQYTGIRLNPGSQYLGHVSVHHIITVSLLNYLNNLELLFKEHIAGGHVTHALTPVRTDALTQPDTPYNRDSLELTTPYNAISTSSSTIPPLLFFEYPCYLV
jgi:hypothetical protein